MSDLGFGAEFLKWVEKDMGTTARKILVWILYFGAIVFVTILLMTAYGLIKEHIPPSYVGAMQFGLYILFLVVTTFAANRLIAWMANKRLKQIDKGIDKSKRLLERVEERVAYAEKVKAEGDEVWSKAEKLVNEAEKMGRRLNNNILPVLAKAVEKGIGKVQKKEISKRKKK